MRKLESPRERLRILALGRRVHENALEMKGRSLRFLVFCDLH